MVLRMSDSNLIDLSHTIEHGMITYKGLPAPIICDYLSREASHARYAPGTEFQIGKIQMVANTGTYIDSPFHRYPDGDDVSQLRLESLANLDCIVFDVTRASDRAVNISPPDDLSGKAVLFHTGWSKHWRTDQYFEQHPYLSTAALAQVLVDQRVALVGIDSFNIDCTDDGERPVHSTLLRAGIPIVEHLCRLE